MSDPTEQDNLSAMLENYINGNLSTALQQAKPFTHAQIRRELRDGYFYSEQKAALTADYLLTGEGRQQACDAL